MKKGKRNKKKQTNNNKKKNGKRKKINLILPLVANLKKKMSLDLVVAWSKQFFDPEKALKMCVVYINMYIL